MKARTATDPEDRSSLMLAAVLAGTFVGTINNSVANLAVIDVLDDFDVDLNAGVWFVTSYVLAFAVLMPVAGRLADHYGLRVVYTTGLLLFAISSAAVALAPTYPTAVAARVAQGISNAPVLPVVMVTVARAFSPGARGRAMGIWAATNGAAIALGPPIGGLVAATIGWRAIFWADVPLAIAAFVLARRVLPVDLPRSVGRFDTAGAVLLSTGLVALMIGLSQAPEWGWTTPATVSLIIGGFVALIGFWHRSHQVPAPFLPIEVLRNRAFAVLSAIASLQMVVLFSVLFATPLVLSSLFDRSVGIAGAIVFALPVAMVLTAPSMGRIADRVGTRRLTFAGGCVMAAAGAVLAAGVVADSIAVIVLGLLLTGVGVASVQAPAAAQVAEEVDDEQRGGALGLFHTTRFLSGVLGTAIVGSTVTAIAGGVLDASTDAQLQRAFVAAYAVALVAAVGVVAASHLVPSRPRVAGSYQLR